MLTLRKLVNSIDISKLKGKKSIKQLVKLLLFFIIFPFFWYIRKVIKLLLIFIPFFRYINNYIKYRQFDLFSIIEIETITACNKRCSYCPNSKFDRGLLINSKKIDINLFYKIINQLFQVLFIFGCFNRHCKEFRLYRDDVAISSFEPGDCFTPILLGLAMTRRTL